jgi:hypothetical protein
MPVIVAIKGEQITRTVLHQVPRPVSPPTAPPVGIGLVEISETLETVLVPGPMGPAGPPGPAGGVSLPIEQSDVVGLVDELAEKLEDAPSDGNIYARLDAAWVEIPGIGGISPTEYNYNASALVPPPNTNNLRLNNANQNLATAMYVHDTNAMNVDVSNAIHLIQQGNTLLLQDKTNANNFRYYNVTGPVVDGGAYTNIPIAYVSGGGTVTAGRVMLAAFGMGSAEEVIGGIITISNTAPSSPAVNDVWIDTN